VKSSLTQALAGRPQVGLFLFYPAPGIIERIGPDWDWILIDGQHGELGYEDIIAAVRACDLIGCYSVVRVAGHDAGMIGKVLDTATNAIMVPMVDTEEQAAALVQAVKFPPLGRRSFGGRRCIDLQGRGYACADAVQPMLICQIETRAGLENVDAIGAVPGVDAVFFGADDLALGDGLDMDRPRSASCFDDALRSVADSAHAHGLAAGGVFTTPDDVSKALGWGYRLIIGAADAAILAAGSKAQSEQLRVCLSDDKRHDG